MSSEIRGIGTRGSRSAKWTFIVYAAGDNNLMESIRRDISQLNQLKKANQDINVVGLFDSGFQDYIAVQEGNLSRTGAVKFKLDGKTRTDFPGRVLSHEGQVNMGDPKTLRDLILWAMRKYPAEHYALLIIDHGQGWLGIAHDEDFVTKSGDDRLTSEELRQALSQVKKRTGKKIDLVIMDACLMGQLEVLYQLKEFVNFVIASEAREKEEGWDYTRINFSFPADPKELARRLTERGFDGFSVRTLSAYDLTKLGAFTKAFNELLSYVLKELPSERLRAISKRILNLPSISQGFFYDFKDFYTILSIFKEELKGDKRAEKLIGKLESALRDLNFVSKSNIRGLKGVSIDANPEMTEEYLRLEMSKETLWNEFLTLSSERTPLSSDQGNQV